MIQTVQPETEAPTQALPEAETTVQTDAETVRELDAIAARYGATGVQAAWIRDGRTAGSYTFGYADRAAGQAVRDDSAFRCASLSKTVCAMVVLRMQTDGLLRIDDDIGTLLGFPVRNPRYPDAVITLRMLMAHTSSIIDSTDFLDSRNAASSVPLRDLLSRRSSYSGARPGTQYAYSNFGVAVLAAAAETAAGKSFETLAQQYLFRPLAIDASFSASTLAQPQRAAALYGTSGNVQWSAARQMQETPARLIGQTHHIYQGNLTISASDYAAILCMLLHAADGSDTRLFPQEAAREMLSMQFRSASVTQGLCVKKAEHVMDGRSFWSHTGSNFGMYAAYVIDPADKSGVVVLTSGANAVKDSSELPNICAEIIRTLYARALG